MHVISEQKLKAIILVQNWGAGKIPIGTEYKLKDSDRILKLVEEDGYPHGKFVFDDGEEFDVGKYFDCFFFEIMDEKDDDKSNESVYNEDVWDIIDRELNIDQKGSIRKTLGSIQKNELFHNIAYYDVSEIFSSIIKNKNKDLKDMCYDLKEQLNNYLVYNHTPSFTKGKIYTLFATCEFVGTSDPEIMKIIKDNQDMGYLISEGRKYIFAPRNKEIEEDYKYEDNNTVGFFYTAENYLDIALSTIKRYKSEFIPLYNNTFEKNKESYLYQADASIKTLLAFSCECYLKSLIIHSGKNLNEIKGLGHGLTALYTSLNDNQISFIFSYMEANGYNLDNLMFHSTYETNDLTEKFMLDLAKIDDAFVNARYSAEKDTNTDYQFLHKFALALRECSKKELSIDSPFEESIELNVNKR